MNTNLDLPTVELTTVVAKVPLNGSPSSSDFNAFQEEVLNDLAEICNLVNEQILPVINALPTAAASGLDGSTAYASRSIDSPLFHDQNGNFYLVSDVLSSLSNAQQSLSASMDSVNAQILALQTRLATTNQNNLQNSVQALQNSVLSIQTTLNSMAASVSSATLAASNFRGLSLPFTALPAGINPVTVLFSPPFADNNYTPTFSIEIPVDADTPTGHGTPATFDAVVVGDFVKLANGSGLTVNLITDTTAPTGILHVLARAL